MSDHPAQKRLDTCPECGEPIEVTVKVYLTDVVIVGSTDGPSVPTVIEAYDQSKFIGADTAFYCTNGHEIDFDAVFGAWPAQVRGVRGGEYRVD